MPILGLTERERFPRLGKIHLGIRHPEKGYPMKTDYFVLPKDNPVYNDMVKLFGETPKELRVMIPAEDEELWASQYYKAYDQTHGLICKGDGVTATRLVDMKTKKWPAKDAEQTTMIDMPCQGLSCPEYKAKKCGEHMNLQVIIPEVPGLGVWQIDTGSKNSIININSCSRIIKMAFGRLSRIPLILSLESAEVKNPENGKRQTVYVLHLRANVTLAELATSAKAIDKSLLLTSPEFEAQLSEQVEKDIDELWGKSKEEPQLSKAEIKDAKNEPEPSQDKLQTKKKPPKEEGNSNPPEQDTTPTIKDLDFDSDVFLADLKEIKWKEATIKSYCNNIYKTDKDENPLDTSLQLIPFVASLKRENREKLFKEIEDRKTMR